MKFQPPLQVFTDAGVEFIVVGGLAALAHGSSRTTLDLDIVYRRSPDNMRRLAEALKPYNPYLRGPGIPPGLPFTWDEKTIKQGLNFTLSTALGEIDLLGEITGGGGYEDLLPYSENMELFGIPVLCLGLDRLILVKRAAARPKDFESIAILEALREERMKGES